MLLFHVEIAYKKSKYEKNHKSFHIYIIKEDYSVLFPDDIINEIDKYFIDKDSIPNGLDTDSIKWGIRSVKEWPMGLVHKEKRIKKHYYYGSEYQIDISYSNNDTILFINAIHLPLID